MRWRWEGEDFFRILTARKPTGIFFALPLRGRPLADGSPARVVRESASSKNLPVIFAGEAVKTRKKSSASTSCGRRSRGWRDRGATWFTHGARPWGSWAGAGERRGFFHAMENFFAVFPHNGKLFSTVWKKQPDFSTQWKTFSRFFHTMEKKFPRCGKTSSGDFAGAGVMGFWGSGRRAGGRGWRCAFRGRRRGRRGGCRRRCRRRCCGWCRPRRTV